MNTSQRKNSQFDELLAFAVRTAKQAGAIQLSYFRSGDLSIRTKSNVFDVVTRANKESEAYIV